MDSQVVEEEVPFLADLSTIKTQEQQAPMVSSEVVRMVKSYWEIYTLTHVPAQLGVQTLPKHPLIKLINLFHQAFESLQPHLKITSETRQYYDISLHLPTLLDSLSDDHILRPIFAHFIFETEYIITALNIVYHHHLCQNADKKEKKINVMAHGHHLTNIIDIKAHMVDNFVSVEAVVVKVQHMKMMGISMEFECFGCRESFLHYFTNGNYMVPSRCLGGKKKSCKSKTFTPNKLSLKTIFIQRIKVQEVDPEGRVPRQILCEVRENLVGRIMTGETLIISGVIRTESSNEKDKKTQGIFTPYILVNSIKSKGEEVILEDDKKILQTMKSDKRIFYSLIKSFCPTIYGYELVKAGLILGLVGGSAKGMTQECSFRETSHLLLLGDPGIGKSQLLKFAAQILPHSVYINATSMSTCGLTVSVNRDGQEQSLEAGALILSDNGICAIDEFDKAPDSNSLLEAMEQQTISIAKAGIICQLKCRVGIVASANPVQGCYNKSKTFMENTKISNAILSRFDLIFLLVDRPDPDRDKKLSEHIMKVHNKKRKKGPQNQPVSPFLDLERMPDFLSLHEKYSRMAEAHTTTYSLQYMKKYLTYVRSSVHPALTKPAADILKSFYLTLRQNNPANSFHITNRQLQSLIRLAMARARIQCRQEVTEEDAFEVTQLMQESLFDSFEEMGYSIHNLRNQVKKGKINNKKNGQLSRPKQRNLFISTLAELQEDRLGNLWSWGQLVKVARDLELNVGDFHEFIERLNQQGVLLQKGGKQYAFQNPYL